MSPLRGSIVDFSKRSPQLDIIWDTRSLYEFGEGHLEALLDDYDLIIFDHPYSGDISDNGWFINLSERLSSEEKTKFANDSLGPGWQSYQTATGIWGLPIDAAAQVACYRPDLMDKLDFPVPRSITEVLRLARKAHEQHLWIALPLAPCDAICTFMTLAANIDHGISRTGNSFPDRDACRYILKTMRELVDVVHPDSLRWNPIKCYEHMSSHEDVCYVPFAFGYTNYSRQSSAKTIRFCDIPGLDSEKCSGATLGGAGIGISAETAHADIAIEYAKFLCDPNYQDAEYFTNGGQPASLSAWQNETNDANISGFFSGTMDTMKNACLRPTLSGFMPYFRGAGRQINACLHDDVSIDSTTKWLITHYSKLF